MSQPAVRLYRDEEPEQPARIDAAAAAYGQASEAQAALYRHPDLDWLHFPWRGVDAIVDGIGEGEVWFVGGFSGAGKTTALMNFSRELLDQRKRVYYLGTETKPKELRTKLACAREGIYAGDVLSGKAAREYTHWPAIRQRLVDDMERQAALGPENQFLVCPVQKVHAGALRGAFDDAAIQDADVLIIDHIDHIEHGGGRNAFEDAKLLAHLVLDLAQETMLRVIVATQFNNEGAKGDIFGLHRPPQPHHVYMGGKKRQIAWGMLGLFRPMRDDVTAEDMKRARVTGIVKPLLEPGVLAVSCMKHRHHGAHEHEVCRLRFERGRLTDLPEKDRYSTSYDGVQGV